MSKLKSGLIQMSLKGSTEDSPEQIRDAMLAAHLPLIDKAGAAGVQILCFQEVFTQPYFCPSQDARWYAAAEAIPDGYTVSLMREYAKKHNMVIIVPIYEEAMTGVYYNTAAVIDADGSYLGKILIGPILAESVRARQWVGFVLGTLGVALVSSRYFSESSSSMTGVLFCVVGVIGMSIGTLYQKRFCASMDLLSGSFLQFVSAATMMIVLAEIFESRQVDWTGEFVFALGWLVVLPGPTSGVTVLRMLWGSARSLWLCFCRKKLWGSPSPQIVG